MSLNEETSRSMSKYELAAFIGRFADNLLEEPEAWENDTLVNFLRALSAWLYDMDLTRFVEAEPEPPTWWLISEMLQAAKIYE